MTCFAPDDLIALLERGGLDALGPDERVHLAECAPCREAWVSVAAADGVLQDALPAARPKARAPWTTALAAAGIMVAVIGLSFYLRSQPQGVPAGQQADLKEVAELIRALDSDDPAARSVAEARLVKLGPGIRPQLQEALAKAASEETRGRIRSVLQKYVQVEEEQYAIRRLEKKDAFPYRSGRRVEVSVETGMSVAAAVEKVARAYELKVEFYAGDDELRQESSRTLLEGGFVIGNGDADTALAMAVSKAMDATVVVDGERLVVVRLTPSVLLARIDLEDAESSGQWILRDFEGTLHDYWKGPLHFLATRGDRGGEVRRKWVEILSACALDASRSVDLRRRALRGLQAFFGRTEIPQPDVTATFLKVFRQKAEAGALRVEALHGLTNCMEDEARESLLAVLEGRDPAMSRPLLGYFIRSIGIYSAIQKIRTDPPSQARLEAALRGLEEGADRDVALRALAFDAILGREEAATRLCKAAEPADRATLYLMLDALRVGASNGWGPVLDRVDALAGHPDPRVRAVVAGLYGRSAGGSGRERDVRGALALLGDREPLVRWSAAYALGTIYSSSAAERYFEGWPACRERLDATMKSESHPKVRAQLEAALLDATKN